MIENGRNMSTVIMMLLMKYTYAPPDDRKWDEHVSHNSLVKLMKREYALAES